MGENLLDVAGQITWDAESVTRFWISERKWCVGSVCAQLGQRHAWRVDTYPGPTSKFTPSSYHISIHIRFLFIVICCSYAHIEPGRESRKRLCTRGVVAAANRQTKKGSLLSVCQWCECSTGVNARYTH